METRQVSNGATVAGIILIVLGIVFFVVTLGAFDLTWSNMGTLWPVFPIIVGLAFVAGYFAGGREEPGLLWAAAIIGGIGLVFLFITGTAVGYGVLAQLWPIALIILGLLMLVPRIRRTTRD